MSHPNTTDWEEWRAMCTRYALISRYTLSEWLDAASIMRNRLHLTIEQGTAISRVIVTYDVTPRSLPLALEAVSDWLPLLPANPSVGITNGQL